MDASTNQNNSLRSDVAARQAIEKNNDDLLAVPRNALDNNAARDTAREDVANFSGIKNEAERFFAALAIGDTAEKQAAYKAELLTINPDIAKEAESLRAVITDYERQFERGNRQDGAFSGINAQTRQPELFPYVEPVEKRPLERFELHDPRDDVKYSYRNQTEMEAKAEEIGSTRYYGVTTDDQRVTFAKTEGKWKAQPYSKEADALAQAEAFKERIERDTKYPIPTERMANMAPALRQAFDEMGVDGDANLEKAASQHIEARSIAYANAVAAAKHEKLDALPQGNIAARLEEMQKPEPGVANPELSKQWADIDAADFLKLQQPERREYAATLIATNAINNAEYKAALKTNSPDVFKEVSALEASNEEKIALKEISKEIDAQQMVIDPATLERVAANRARDTTAAREALGLNTVEPDIEKEKSQLAGDEEAKRAAWLSKSEQPKAPERTASGNGVESDEVFTATGSEIKPVIPPEIDKQYLRVGNKYFDRANTKIEAFEDKGNKLETKSNGENVAESMVRIAQSRGWDEIKVTGSETFRKEAWLEAASRGMHVKGYSPTEQDKIELAKRDQHVEKNQVAKENRTASEIKDEENKRKAESFAKDHPNEAIKKYPELAGAVAAVDVMDKKAEADGLNPAQRAIVAARVRQNVTNSIERGYTLKMDVKEEMAAQTNKEVTANNEREYAR